ncbi:MAG: hypothetical protein GXO71_07800 [Caldiserica bacterium]|nr:hypothetical protein [Caldisericota bacterium]
MFLLGTMVAPGFSAEKITQGDFAMLLVRVLGMEGNLPPAATVEDYGNLLSSLGIEPADGWDYGVPLTLGDLYDMLDIYGKGDRSKKLTLDEVLKILEKWVGEVPTYVPETAPVSAISPVF